MEGSVIGEGTLVHVYPGSSLIFCALEGILQHNASAAGEKPDGIRNACPTCSSGGRLDHPPSLDLSGTVDNWLDRVDGLGVFHSAVMTVLEYPASAAALILESCIATP